MGHSFAARVRSIVSGSLDDLVRAMGGAEAEAVVRAAIREIERMCRETRSEVAILAVELAKAGEQLAGVRAAANDASLSAVGAIEMHRDDRAEVAIVRQARLESQLPVLERALAVLGQRQAELAGFLAALEGRRSGLEADLAAYAHARAGVATADRRASRDGR